MELYHDADLYGDAEKRSIKAVSAAPDSVQHDQSVIEFRSDAAFIQGNRNRTSKSATDSGAGIERRREQENKHDTDHQYLSRTDRHPCSCTPDFCRRDQHVTHIILGHS